MENPLCHSTDLNKLSFQPVQNLYIPQDKTTIKFQYVRYGQHELAVVRIIHIYIYCKSNYSITTVLTVQYNTTFLLLCLGVRECHQQLCHKMR
jgi:hypothetical protein